jgi:hypothetical protein
MGPDDVDPSPDPTREGHEDLDGLVPWRGKWLFDIGRLYTISVLDEDGPVG